MSSGPGGILKISESYEARQVLIVDVKVIAQYIHSRTLLVIFLVLVCRGQTIRTLIYGRMVANAC